MNMDRATWASSASDDWATPQDFFDALHAEFGFTMDVCASADNAKCPRYFTREQDGLAQEWADACWCNPPYGRSIGLWMRKAWESSLGGTTVVCLVPARTDTRWWHDYAMRGEIRFVRGRIKFSGHKHDAPFPCAVVIFRKATASEAAFRSSSVSDAPLTTRAPWGPRAHLIEKAAA